MALIESQHKYFLEDVDIDNSGHIKAIKRIADTAYQFLTANGISSGNSNKIKEKLINHGKDLFCQLWMQDVIEEGETPSQKDLKEAESTFEKILKTGKD